MGGSALSLSLSLSLLSRKILWFDKMNDRCLGVKNWLSRLILWYENFEVVNNKVTGVSL